MATNNSTILAKVALVASNDYQQRIPDVTQGTVANTMEHLFAPMNNDLFNQFMNIFVQRIGMTIVRDKAYKNPLAVFKGSKMSYGATIQEAAFSWIKAHSYADDVTDLLAMERPDGSVCYHSQNRRDKYPITVNYAELQTAVTDEMGLNRFADAIMTVPQNSDEYDEYLIMKQLIAEYETRWGFFKHNLSATPTDESTGKEFLTAVRTYVGKLAFPSTLYNAQNVTHIPVFAKPEEMVLLVTPETAASLSVEVLASLFHVEAADINVRQIVIDEFPIPDAVALLTTEDFFVCHDTLYQAQSFFDSNTLNNQYFLHHWGIYSVTPYVPAILFTTAQGTAVATTTFTPTGVTLSAESATVAQGGTDKITVTLAGSWSDDQDGTLTVKPNAVTWSLAASLTEGEGDEETTTPVDLAPQTYVDAYGTLHVQTVAQGSLAEDTAITVTGTATYINPSGATTSYTDSVTVTIS